MATPGEESVRESDWTSISSPGLSLGCDSTSGTSKHSPSDVWKHFIKMKETRKNLCKIRMFCSRRFEGQNFAFDPALLPIVKCINNFVEVMTFEVFLVGSPLLAPDNLIVGTRDYYCSKVFLCFHLSLSCSFSS